MRSRTTSSETESLASNLQCVPAEESWTMAAERLGEVGVRIEYEMNLSMEASAAAVIGPDVSGDRITSRKGCSSATASSSAESAKFARERSTSHRICLRGEGNDLRTFGLPQEQPELRKASHESDRSPLLAITRFGCPGAQQGAFAAAAAEPSPSDGLRPVQARRAAHVRVGRLRCGRPALVLAHGGRDGEDFGIDEVERLHRGQRNT